jgi:hypothetical protein
MSTEIKEFDDLHAQVQLFVSPVKGMIVTNSTENEVAIVSLKKLSLLKKTIESKRVDAVKPMNDRVKSINDYAKQIVAPLDDAEKFMKGIMSKFAEEERLRRELEVRKIREKQEAEARAIEIRRKAEIAEEQKRKEEAKRKLQEEQAEIVRKAKEAQEKERIEISLFGVEPEIELNQSSIDAAHKVKQQEFEEREKQEEQRRLARDAEIAREAKEREREAQARIRAVDAARAKNTREVTEFEIVDPSVIPDQYWVIDKVAIGVDVRKGIQVFGVMTWKRTIVVA